MRALNLRDRSVFYLIFLLAFCRIVSGQEHARQETNYANVPLYFEENRGQADARGRYLVRGGNLTGFLTADGWVASQGGEAVAMHLGGANSKVRLVSGERLEGISNYFIDKLAVTGVPHFASVRGNDIRPGVDVVYHSHDQDLEFDFVIHPGANPGALRLRFEGRARPELDANGDIVLKTPAGELRQHKPRVLQGDHEIPCRYELASRGEVRLVLGDYDPSAELLVDPVLSYSTFLGGSNSDSATGIAVDASGFAYITGTTTSPDFPVTSGTLHGTFGSDAFVSKLNAAGSGLVYSTFIGGSGSDQASGIAIDAAGNAYISGTTGSSDFPSVVAYSGFQPHAFAVKLGSTGSLVYSRVLAGNGGESGTAIAVDAAGFAYVTGTTSSTNFPTTPGVLRTAPAGGADAFVAKLDGSGQLAYGTLFGGSAADSGTSIAVDASGDAFVGGVTASPNFPATAGAYSTIYRGANDGFIAKLNPGGTALLYATYLSGSSDDSVNGIAIDAAGNAYVTGTTQSSNFPATSGAFLPTKPSAFGLSAFVSKIDAAGASLLYSTFLGGTSGENGIAIAVDSNGFAYVVGNTGSADFPTTPGALKTRIATASFSSSTDIFLVKITSDGSVLAYSTLLGASTDAETPTAVTLDGNGGIYLAGQTNGSNYPVTAGAYQTSTTKASFNATGVITKIDFNSPLLCNASFSPTSVSVPGHGGPISFSMTLPAGCPWEAVPDSFITLNPPVRGVASNTPVSFTGSVGQNSNISSAITGGVRVGAATFVVNQDAGSCVDPLITPSSVTFDSAGGIRDLGIVLPPSCTWMTSLSTPWLTATASGSGSGIITLFAGQNSFSQRTATLTVAGKSISITQTGASCTAVASAAPTSFPAQGGTGFAKIATNVNTCAWTAYSSVPWIQLSVSGATGAGTSGAPFIVASNPGSVSRSGQILIGDQILAITQAAGPAGTPGTFTQSVFAGGGPASLSSLGDEGPAVGSFLSAPRGLAFDPATRILYIVDSNSSRIRSVTPDGQIHTFAGGGGSTSEGVPATSAQLNALNFVAVDGASAVYLDDSGSRVRKVSGGNITTFAGTLTSGFSGDPGPATSAQLARPSGIAADNLGNVYIADTNNNRVRVVNAGNINTFAGGGSGGLGDGGAANTATLSFPGGLGVDAAGRLLIADVSNNRIRRVSSGNINTIAGGGFGSDGGLAVDASLSQPTQVTTDPLGDIYIVDSSSHLIRMVGLDGKISTILNPSFSAINGLATDSSGNVYFSDGASNVVRKLTTPGTFCSFSVATPPIQPVGGGPLSVAVSAPPGCSWTADTNASWITLNSGTSGTGNGTVQLTLSSNTGNPARTGILGVAGQAIPITQLGIASLQVVKSHLGGFAQGANGVYQVTVSNAAGADATIGTVTVTENLPSAMSLVSMSGTGWNCNLNTCNRSDSLAGGSSYPPITVTVAVLVNATTPQLNQVTVSGGGSAPASASDSTVILKVPALSVSATHSGNFAVGQQNATYSISVSNAIGSAPTSGTVTVTDTLPSGLSLVLMSGTGWVCVSNSCTRSDALAGGATYPTITVTVNVAANAASVQVNQVSVSGGGSPFASSSDNIFIASPFLSVTKTHNGNFAPGQQNATYIATVSNFSSAPTSGTVTLTEVLPAGLALVSMAGTGWTCASNACTRNDPLPAGGTYPSVIITVNVSATAASQVINQVVVSGGGAPSVSSSDLTTIGGTGGGGTVAISSVHQGNFVQGQQNAFYTVTVSNPSNSGAISGIVTVTDTLPAGFTLASMFGTGWNCSSNICNRTDGLAAGSSYPPITVNVNVGNNVSSPQLNQVAVTVSGAGNASNTDGTIVNQHGLILSKSHSGNFIPNQQNASYTLTVSNSNGTAASSGTITVTDTLPSGMTLVSMTGSGWTCSAASCSRADSLAAGATYPAINVVVNVGANAAPNSVNIATLSGGSVVGLVVVDDLTAIVPPGAGLSLSRSSLNFGVSTSVATSAQRVNVTMTNGVLGWTAVSNQPNITVSPASGTGSGSFNVSAAAGPSGTVTVSSIGLAGPPPQVAVNVGSVTSGVPYGSFDTPANNSTGISGAIPVTGWALDNVEVTKVDIWREPVGSEPAGLVFIGDAVFVADARPDVQAANPTTPLNYRAGWGYLLLTNFLPSSNGGAPGNGTYKLHAIAHNKGGASTDLGTKTITVDNLHASKPFGTIDTPTQGGTASGNAFVNFGWALTQNPYCIPIDGSTITVLVDGAAVGHPTYNQNRSDIANAFPGLCNSSGAVGYFLLDTTQLTNGVHTISWVVYDNQNRGDGIGSRFFTVQNGSGPAAAPDLPATAVKAAKLRRGYDPGSAAEALKAGEKGEYTIDIEELDRIELEGGFVSAGRLPAGSTIRRGVFTWQLAPGFLGDNPLVLRRVDGSELRVRVRVRPKNFGRE